MSLAFAGALVGTIAMTAALVVVHLAARESTVLRPEDALPALVSTAAILLAALTWRRAPTVAWLAVIVAGAVATIDLAVIARSLRPLIDPSTWRWLTVGIGLAALWSAGSAVAYASEPSRRLGGWVLAVGGAGLAAVAAATIWALAQGSTEPVAGTSAIGPTGLLTRTYLVAATVAVMLGLLGDARAPLTRARRRVDLVEPGEPDRAAWIRSVSRAFVDEIAPGRTRARQAALAERARIARDLHADVVPGLRRAVRLAEDGDDLDRLAAQLRQTLAEVEDLGSAEHAVQLDIGGLLPALESLAEHVEATSDITVTIDVPDATISATEPPRDVAVAALRIVRLALDNVVRHAPGSHVLLTVEAGGDAVRLTVVDDGPGLRADAHQEAARAGRRGLADMATEAAATGASLEVGRADPSGGTRVVFGWRASRAS